MSALEKYDQVFINCFGLEKAQVGPELKYQGISEWDSVGHMSMIAELEETFGITIDIDDVIAFSSYEEGKSILLRYSVQI